MKIDITSHNGYTKIHKKIRNKTLEIDSRSPNRIYMQYGYINKTGPWSQTSAIHYGEGKFGYNRPEAWPKNVQKVILPMILFMKKLININK